jgi:two-component system chemotaxis response regulator CheY
MKILVVDDSKAMRMIVMRTLRQAGFDGHTFLEAENGVLAHQSIAASSPDLVLCDWNMPEMNGIELLEKLNAEGRKIKFGFITSEASNEMREKATAAGALFLIGKPFTAEAFQSVLQPILTG